MTSSRRLSLRAAVSNRQSGQITVFLALSFLVFLGLFAACWQSLRKQCQRRQSEQAVEAGLFSLFSEYEPHLLEDYDLFYLDTSFGGGTERTEELYGHLWHFISEGIAKADGGTLYGLELQGINTDHFVRATDGRGAVFYRQAIEVMKERTGVDLAEDWLLQEESYRKMQADADDYQADCEQYEESVVDYGDEEELDAEVGELAGLRGSFTLSAAVPKGYTVSTRTIDLKSVPSYRELSAGIGRADGSEGQLISKQWFITYLCEYLKSASDMLPQQRGGGYLDYQLEYILHGDASDAENLKRVVLELMLLREGSNYIFLNTHSRFSDEAGTLALVLVGIFGNEALTEAVRHLILIAWAYGESVVEIRQLLGGYELSLVKSEEDWQVPLSGLLSLMGNPGRYDEQKNRQAGLSYETFLRLFLSLQPPETLAMRALDVIEGELQAKGCRQLHLDHCVEQIDAQVWLDGIYLERTYGYE